MSDPAWLFDTTQSTNKGLDNYALIFGVSSILILSGYLLGDYIKGFQFIKSYPVQIYTVLLYIIVCITIAFLYYTNGFDKASMARIFIASIVFISILLLFLNLSSLAYKVPFVSTIKIFLIVLSACLFTIKKSVVYLPMFFQ